MFKYKVLRDVNIFGDKVEEEKTRNKIIGTGNVLHVTVMSNGTGRRTMLPVVAGVLEEFEDFDEEKDYLFINETLFEEITIGLKKNLIKAAGKYLVTSKLKDNRLDWNILKNKGKI